MRHVAFALAAALVVAAGGQTPSRVLFHLVDRAIDEASGVAVATREPQVWFTHNDSGDAARFFALGPQGQTLATYDVDNARNVDWEDMASAPRNHLPTLWFGDIGDNTAVRRTVDVYAVAEPAVPVGRAATVHVRAVRYRFRYPAGPRNAESLLVDPRSSQIYVATKTYDGTTEVYAAPAHPSATSVSVLRRIATLHWPPPTRPTSIVTAALALATTGGAYAPDGSTVVLRTYTDAYLFRVAGSGPAALAKALAGRPRALRLPVQPQGEGVCFTRDGKALVLTSEKPGAAVWQVRLPTSAAPTSAAPTSPQPPGALSSPPPTATPAAARSARAATPGSSALPAIAVGVAAVVVVTGTVVFWRRVH